jgi:hypothetical protein
MRKTILTLILSLSLLTVSTAFTQPQANVTDNQVTINFPETATFRAKITSDTEIQSVVLEYGNEQQTCGEVIAKAFPQFTPGKTVTAEWTWEMRQSGSLPPGTTLWWRWHITDANGKETVSETKTAIWLDDIHDWQSITSGQLHLHWYGKDKAFAQRMLNAGLEGLKRNETQAGLTTDSPINFYIYPNYADMRDATLYEPSWTGGQAFSEVNIVIMGISQSDTEWDQNTVIHELTHVLVGHLTFSCLGDVPTWLNEGLAVYSEGKLDDASQQQLDDAIRNDTLLTIRSLSSGFSEIADKMYLSYSQSYSVVKFLIETHGQEKMNALLGTLRDGNSVDDALQQTYGFDIEGLEDAWRQSIGAKPRTVSAQPTAQPTPTYVPTIVPISGAPSISLQATPTAVPTSSVNAQPTLDVPENLGPPIALTLFLLAFCCVFLLIIGVIVLTIIVRKQNQKGGQNVQ